MPFVHMLLIFALRNNDWRVGWRGCDNELALLKFLADFLFYECFDKTGPTGRCKAVFLLL